MRMYACTAAVICALISSAAGFGAVTTIGPFTGEFHDTFDQYDNVNALLSLSVFDGHGSIDMLDPEGAIKIEFASQLGSDLVLPISDMMIGQLGIAEWKFPQPAYRFGGYWENNSGASNATVRFYDASNNLLDTLIAMVPRSAQQWTWNGWQSDVPFSRIHVTGNGLINGFIWYENMEVSFAPEPTTAAGSLAGLMAAWMRRRRSRRVYVAVVSCASALSAAALSADDASPVPSDTAGCGAAVESAGASSSARCSEAPANCLRWSSGAISISTSPSASL